MSDVGMLTPDQVRSMGASASDAAIMDGIMIASSSAMMGGESVAYDGVVVVDCIDDDDDDDERQRRRDGDDGAAPPSPGSSARWPSLSALSTVVGDGVYPSDESFDFEVICAENEIYKGEDEIGKGGRLIFTICDIYSSFDIIYFYNNISAVV